MDAATERYGGYYNRAILGTESFKKCSHCDGHLVESPVTVRVMILMIPRKVISYDPISFGPCRKEVLGGITPRHPRCDQTSLLFVFFKQTKITLENLKIEEEAKHS